MERNFKRQLPGKETTVEDLPPKVLRQIAARLPARSLLAAKEASLKLRNLLLWCDDKSTVATHYATTRTPVYLTLLSSVRDYGDGIIYTFIVRDSKGSFYLDKSISTLGHFRLEYVAPNGLVWMSATESPCTCGTQKRKGGLRTMSEMRTFFSSDERDMCMGENCYDSPDWKSYVLNPASKAMIPVPLSPIHRPPQDDGRCMSFDPATSICTLMQVRLCDSGSSARGYIDVCRIDLSNPGGVMWWESVYYPSALHTRVVDLAGFALPHGNIRVESYANHFFWVQQQNLPPDDYKVWILNALDYSLGSLKFPCCRFKMCKFSRGLGPGCRYNCGDWSLCEVGGQVILIHKLIMFQEGDHFGESECWKLARAGDGWQWEYVENGFSDHFCDLIRQPFRYAAFGENVVMVGPGMETLVEYDSRGRIARRISIQGLETMLVESLAQGGTGIVPMNTGSLDGPGLPETDRRFVGVWAFEDNNIAWPASYKNLVINLSV